MTLLRRCVVLLLWTIHSQTPFVVSHPQCLDFRPPFPTESGSPSFCQEYTSFGCCTATQDQEVASLHQRFLDNLSTADTSSGCRELLKQVLCLRCSPYAAHIFDSELDGIASTVPGLCSDFCSRFYTACRSVIPLLSNDTDVPSLTPEGFCQLTQITDMDYCYPDLQENPVFTRELVTSSTSKEGCLCLEEFARDIRNPLALRSPPDQSGRIMIAEQIGVVYVFFKNGTRIPEPFIDLSSQVKTSRTKGDERGFLGLAFHPDFAANGKLYCYFFVKSLFQQYTQVMEFTVSRDNPNKVDATSGRHILSIDQPYWNHNGGEILFGMDGYLYLFLGDGGHAGDPGNRSQNKSLLLGKVLRIDVNVPPGSSRPYRIPDDNPFVNEANSQPEIFAYGLRNPWRCDVDEGDPETGYGRGRIFCSDVGQSAYEEVDIIVSGGNYGWNAREGFQCFREEVCGKIGPEELPIHVYNHTVGKSVTGGHVYRGCLNPALHGRYIFGDFFTGRLFSLEESADGTSWTDKEIHMCGSDVCFNGLVNEYEVGILSFGEDDDGEIYILTTPAAIMNRPTGKVYKLIDPRRRGDPSKCKSHVPLKSHIPEKQSTVGTVSQAVPAVATKLDLILTSVAISIMIYLIQA